MTSNNFHLEEPSLWSSSEAEKLSDDITSPYFEPVDDSHKSMPVAGGWQKCPLSLSTTQPPLAAQAALAVCAASQRGAMLG